MVITGLTRNQFAGNRTWVRIPPAPPVFVKRGLLHNESFAAVLFLFGCYFTAPYLLFSTVCTAFEKFFKIFFAGLSPFAHFLRYISGSNFRRAKSVISSADHQEEGVRVVMHLTRHDAEQSMLFIPEAHLMAVPSGCC